MADSAVGRSFRLVVDRVNAAASRRPPVCLSVLKLASSNCSEADTRQIHLQIVYLP